MSRIFGEEAAEAAKVEGIRHVIVPLPLARPRSGRSRSSFPLPPIPRSLSPPAISSVRPSVPRHRRLLLFCLLVKFWGDFIRNVWDGGDLPFYLRDRTAHFITYKFGLF